MLNIYSLNESICGYDFPKEEPIFGFVVNEERKIWFCKSRKDSYKSESEFIASGLFNFLEDINADHEYMRVKVLSIKDEIFNNMVDQPDFTGLSESIPEFFSYVEENNSVSLIKFSENYRAIFCVDNNYCYALFF